jgi:hypothetical protein
MGIYLMLEQTDKRRLVLSILSVNAKQQKKDVI